jgi:subtilisin family serine protease
MEFNMKKAMPFRKRQLVSLAALSILVFAMFVGITALPFSAAFAPTSTETVVPNDLEPFFPSMDEDTSSEKPYANVDPNIKPWLETGEIPDGIRTIGGGLEIILTANREIDFSTLMDYMKIINVFDMGLGYYIQGAVYHPKDMLTVSELPGVGQIIANAYRVLDEAPIQGDPVTNQFKAREIMGIEDVLVDFPDLNGTGVTIGIVDTGVDFGVTDLYDAIDLDGLGQPTSYDPGGSGIAITSYALPSVGGYLLTEGLDFRMYRDDGSLWWSNSTYGIYAQNMYVGGISSASGFYRVGMSVQIGDSLPRLFFAFILVDSTTPFVYDTLYVDLETSWAATADYNGADSQGVSADWDFTNNEAHMFDSNPIIAKDFDSDGINDFSMGSLSNTFDLMGQITGDLISGIDPQGRGFAFMFDNGGHGTSCAGSAAGRGIAQFDVYENGTLYSVPGAAPGATIMALKTFTIADNMHTWLWGCGYRPIVPTDWPYDTFTVWNNAAGDKASILSNSWGYSTWSFTGYDMAWSYDWYSMTVDFLTMDSDTLFCISTGNTGPGYGTSGGPSSTMAMNVGASTTSHIWQGYYSNYSQGYDTVADFSSCGPAPQGFSTPDILAVGAYAFDVTPIQLGDGSQDWVAFGGTSQASPHCAGVAAIVLQADVTLGASELRAILMNGADDLGYDVYRQGAGRVNAYNSVYMALDSATLNGTTDLVQIDTYETWYWQYWGTRQDGWRGWYMNMYYGYDYLGNPFDYSSFNPSGTYSLVDGGFFPHPMYRGDSMWYNVSAYTPDGNPVTAVDAYTYTQTGSATANLRSTSTYTTWRLLDHFTAAEMVDFFDADYVVISLVYPQSNLDAVYALSGQANYVFLHDWNDINSNGLIDFETATTAGEVRRIASDTAYGNSHTINLGFPAKHFWNDPAIYYHDVGVELFLWRELNVNVTMYFFDRTPWGWVTTDQYTGGVHPDEPLEWNVTIDVPGSTTPGFYEGYLNASVGSGFSLMPLSIRVDANMTAPGAAGAITWGGTQNTIYDNGAVYGNTQYGYRQQVGDWRFFFVDCYPTSTLVSYVLVNVTWSDPDTRLDVMLYYSSYGYNLMESDNIWENGRFVGDPTWERQNVLLFDASHDGRGLAWGSYLERGLIGIAIRTSDFGGSTGGKEDFYVTVSYGLENHPSEPVPAWNLPYAWMNGTDTTKTDAPITENSTWTGPAISFKTNWSALNLPEFPTISIRQTVIELLSTVSHANYGTIEGPVVPGWNPDLNPREDYDYVDLLAGQTVQISVEFGTWLGDPGLGTALSHGGTDDIDVFVWAPDVAHTYANSLTGGQTATGANPEEGTFTAPVSGTYTIGLDYYSGAVPMGWKTDVFAFQATGVTTDGLESEIDTSITNTNAAYAVQASFVTGTSLDWGTTIGFVSSVLVLNVTVENFFAPSIDSLDPDGGEQLGPEPFTISWTASDPNAAPGDSPSLGETLGFSVEVSNDSGLTWKVVTYGTTLNSLTYDPNSAYYGLGASDTWLVRVNCTDGMFTVSRTSAATFEVVPEQVILAPPYELYVVIAVIVIVVIILLVTCLLKRRQTVPK